MPLIATENLSVVYRTVASLKPYLNNPRTHSKAQIRKIASSLREFGFTAPILVDDQNTIIAGHGRVQAAKLIGLEQVPTIRLSSLSPTQIRAYMIADNRLCLDAGWDQEILKIELQNLIALDEVDISLTGFEVAELDIILNEGHEEDPHDDLAELTGPAITQPGDLWQLDGHRIFCGDATLASSFVTLMGGKQAAVVFTDAPFNVPINGHVSGNGRVHHDEFAMASGEMSKKEFQEFLTTVFTHLAHSSTNGSVHYLCMDWRHMADLLAAGDKVYDSLLNLCVWSKDKGGMGSFYRSRHELVFLYRNGKQQHRNNVQLGRYGRNRTNIWEYPSAGTLSRAKGEENLLAMHPTVKPVALVADALLDCSARGEIVLDCFLGSGSTLLAAERIGRICYGIELEPRYVDLTIRRWQKQTGERAIHGITGKAFDDLLVEEVAHA